MTAVKTLPSSEALYNTLLPNAKTHLDNNPMLTADEYDQNNPYHDIHTTYVPAQTKLSFEESVNLTEVFCEGRFHSEMVSPLLNQPQELIQITSMMKDGKENSAFVTGHESLMDILVGSFAVVTASTELGYAKHDEMIHHMDILLSRTISSFRAFGVPLLDVLRQAGNLHLTLPMSERILSAGITEKQIRAYGTIIGRRLAPSTKLGRMICVAASGQSDKVKYGENGEIIAHYLQPVPEPNANLLRKIRNVKPAGIVMSGDKRCFVPMPMRTIETVADVDEMMHDIADVRQEATGIKTIYLKPDRD